MNWIKSKVVMLPSEKAQLYLDLGILRDIRNTQHIPIGTQIPQHLYFTSNEEIKEGDWFLHSTLADNSIHKCIGRPAEQNVIGDDNMDYFKGFCKKIIATTDKSLYNEILPFEPMERIQYKYLPEPSKEFLEVYVKAYNEGDQITDVLIECEKGFSGERESIEFFERIKVKSDNTITIKKVKDSWSREEIIELFHKYKIDHDGEGCYYKDTLNRWIEQNL